MIGSWLKRLRRRRGAGLIVVMVLAAVMSVYVIQSGVSLRTLQKRLALIETRHRQRIAQSGQSAPEPGR